MSCSKVFSGEIPELTNKIIQYFWDDTSTLHSCILVNRLWCRFAIPLLWEDPFSIPVKNYHFIGIYLHNLNDDDKTELNEYGITFPSNTLFYYPSFIKYLNTYEIINCIIAWASAASNTSALTSNTFTTTASTIAPIKLIHRALLKTFVESNANLHDLFIGDSYPYLWPFNSYDNYDFLNAFFELISQKPNFIHNIKRLKLDIRYEKVILNKIEALLSSNCNLISTLDTRFNAKNYSLQLIESQQNLTIYNNYYIFHSLLLSLKNSNCSNTLKTIIFSRINFKGIVILSEVFEQLNSLESVHLLNCQSLDLDFVQQIINITKPFKLKSLLMTGRDFQVESIRLLLQKSGNYLENIGLSLYPPRLKHKLFEMITKYCTRLKFFNLCATIEANIYLGFDLIRNIGQNLNYLLIYGYSNEVSSIILQKLGQNLPLKLEHLSLTLNTINTGDFEVFFKNSQNTFINKLLIRIVNKGIKGEDLLSYVEKYIMKEKRVKYLALEVDDWDLLHSKDVVRKFKLL